ncbi:MAG: TatD family hydrolase, partial [Alphaproteobacteria bacterium]
MPEIVLVDSHCHLDFPEFSDDLSGTIARAHTAGVASLVTISTRVARFDDLRAIVDAHDNVYCTIGTHPHNADEETGVTADQLVEISKHPKVVGIGECGLDYHYDNADRQNQAAGFRTHICAARETGLPIVIHTRSADADTAQILEEEMGKGAFPGVLHCFTGGMALAEKAVELGMYVSFSGILTFKNSAELRQIAAKLPLDRLLVETDAPFLAPMPHRGKTNQPAFVRHTAQALADLRGLDLATLARATSDNFIKLFNKV